MQFKRRTLIDFDDTEIAFRDHSNYSLRQAYTLFNPHCSYVELII